VSGYDAYDEPPWMQDGNRGQQTQGRRGKGKKPDLGDYTEVKVRIQEFYAKYPDGRIMTQRVKVITKVDPPRVMVQAAAFRSPDDDHPGIGTSWMTLPGKTPYTNGSEVENTETSAWGRAIAAVGVAVDKSIATADEIRNKEDATEGDEGAEGTPTPPPAVAAKENTTEALPADSTTVVPRSLDGKADDEVAEMSYDVFIELAKEKFIHSAVISKTAKALFGETATSLRSLTSDERKRLWHALTTGDISSDEPTESPKSSEPSTISS